MRAAQKCKLARMYRDLDAMACDASGDKHSLGPFVGFLAARNAISDVLYEADHALWKTLHDARAWAGKKGGAL